MPHASTHATATEVLEHLVNNIDDLPELINSLALDLPKDGLDGVWKALRAAKIPNPAGTTGARVFKSVVAHRFPSEKIHQSLGHAKSAVAYNRRGGKLYELIDGAWVLMHEVAYGTATADLPWNKK